MPQHDIIQLWDRHIRKLSDCVYDRFSSHDLCSLYSCGGHFFLYFANKHTCQQSRQLCSTIADTLFSYSRLFSWYSWAAWLLAGLFGLGSSSKDWADKQKHIWIFSTAAAHEMNIPLPVYPIPQHWYSRRNMQLQVYFATLITTLCEWQHVCCGCV